MVKTLFFILTIGSVLAKVEARWLGVSSFLIQDDETVLLFDAPFTRPGFFQLLGLKEFKSDEALVKKVLRDHGIRTLDAIFVTHAHFDHVMDAPIAAKLTGATLFATDSVMKIARAYGDPVIKVEPLRDDVKVGEFRIRSFPRIHAKLLGVFDFLPGPVTDDFDFNFWSYRVGESRIYLIEHPDVTILMDTSATPNLAVLKGVKSIDVLIEGIADRKSNDALIDGYIKSLGPSLFIASHFDNYLKPYDSKTYSLLPTMDVEALEEELKKKMPRTKFVLPELGKKIELLRNPPRVSR